MFKEMDMLDIDFSTFKPENVSIEITPIALNQIKLILENDFTLETQSLRIQIGGKECDGFRYEVGFDKKKENDYEFKSHDLTIFMQPFTAFYCQQITIDYLSDGRNDIDGFLIKNHHQDEYQGKFFKED